MNDTELFQRLRQSLDPVHLPDDLDRVAARGRSLRRRRVALPALAAAVAVVAAVALVQPAAGPSPGAEVHVDLAAWSVDSDGDTVTVTVRELRDPDRLTDVLDDAGVRARVQFVRLPPPPSNCYDPPGQKAIPPGGVVDIAQRADREIVFVIDPGAMPAGTTLKFVIMEGVDGFRMTRMTLVRGVARPCVPTAGEGYPDPGGRPTPAGTPS